MMSPFVLYGIWGLPLLGAGAEYTMRPAHRPWWFFTSPPKWALVTRMPSPRLPAGNSTLSRLNSAHLNSGVPEFSSLNGQVG